MQFLKVLAVALVACLGASAASAVTILYGKEFSFHHEFRGNQFFPQTFIAGEGEEVNLQIRNRTVYTIDIRRNETTNQDELVFQMGNFNFRQGNGFNGLVLRDTIDNLPDFRSLTQISGANLGPITPIVNENEIRIDFSNVGQIAGQEVIFQIEVAPVPLPASGAMLALAVAGGAVLRRRTRKV